MGELSVLVKKIKCLLFHLEAKISSYANLKLSMREKYDFFILNNKNTNTVCFPINTLCFRPKNF
jgi:hypothetical protein